MPSPATPHTREIAPFPTTFRASSDGEGRPALTLLESFAREETVVLVEASPAWSSSGDGPAPEAVFDVVAAYAADATRVNPSTSMTTVTVQPDGDRRFLIGIPAGHKLVVYPSDQSQLGALSSGDAGYLRITIVDYWA